MFNRHKIIYRFIGPIEKNNRVRDLGKLVVIRNIIELPLIEGYPSMLNS